MHGTIGLLIVVAIVGGALMPLLGGRRRAQGHDTQVCAKRLMTDREVAFWRLLVPAAAPLHVAPQVAMGALLRTSSRSTRNRFNRKIVDFALVDDAGEVRLLIELDDRMHDPGRDTTRDRMTAAAGYKTLRIVGVTARDPYLLKAAIDEALGLPASWSPPTFNPATARHRVRNTSAPPSTPPV